MLKRIIFSFLLTALFTPLAHADDMTYKVKVLDIPETRTLVIASVEDKGEGAKLGIFKNAPAKNERLMLKTGKGCQDFKVGMEIEVIVRSTLNASSDFVKTGTEYKCRIERVERVNVKLAVDYVFPSQTEAVVTDEAGNGYSLQFSNPQCRAINAYKGKYVYAYISGSELKANDKLIVPDQRVRCTISFVEPYKKSTTSVDASGVKGDKLRPTRVTQLKGISGNENVYLYWRRSADDTGIDYYIVSYSTGPLDTKKLSVKDMPNQQKATDTRLKVTGLINDKTYYFYVLAVDKKGNMSSDWSEPARVMTKSSIPKDRTIEFAPGSRENN